MSRLGPFVFLLFVFSGSAASQSIPSSLLSAPTNLQLNQPTREIKTGSTVTFTVSLEDSRGNAVRPSKDMQLVVEASGGVQQTVLLPAGHSSATFSLKSLNTGITQITVRSGSLRPATGLILVSPPAAATIPEPRNDSTPHQAATQAPRVYEQSPRAGPPTRGPAGFNARKAPEAALAVPPAAVSTFAGSESHVTPTISGVQATKLELFISPLPVYGDAIDHIWRAAVSVAAINDQGSLAPVDGDVSVHFETSSGTIAPADIVIPAGQFSDFQSPAVLTENRAGNGSVDVVSSLGNAGPVQVNYLQPPPTQLHVTLGSPVLSGAGSSSVTAQICQLDASGAVTSTGENITVSLSASNGNLQNYSPSIAQGAFCTDVIEWSSTAGPASLLAQSSGLASDTASVNFPSFPWYLVWLAALGGLVGGIVRSSGDYFSPAWWSHTWRSLAIGAIFGFIAFIFARYGALVLPKNVPVNLQNMPVTSGLSSFAIGFLGGVLGRGFWGLGEGSPTLPATRNAGQPQPS